MEVDPQDVNDEDTPSLSSSSSPSSSSLSSPEPESSPEDLDEEYVPEPEPEPEPLTKKGRAKLQLQENGERPLTRRQRKALGLPKPRELRVGALSAGKITIPGGRFQRSAPAVKGVDDTVEGVEAVGSGEWKTNGVGRVDVRGFRELKI